MPDDTTDRGAARNEHAIGLHTRPSPHAEPSAPLSAGRRRAYASIVRRSLVAALTLALSCSAAPPPTTPAGQPPLPTGGEEPDRDGDRIPDRCDACPLEPGPLWDDYPVIDGCPSAALHSLVREPEARTLVLGQPPDGIDVSAARTLDLAGALGDGPPDVIACMGVTTAAERGGEALALARAGSLIELLAPRFPGSRFVARAIVGGAPAVEIAIVSRGGHEELRWSGSRYEHVGAAAARARRAEAQGKPSPCGRTPGAPAGSSARPPPPAPGRAP
jgi:hypothetical protein